MHAWTVSKVSKTFIFSRWLMQVKTYELRFMKCNHNLLFFVAWLSSMIYIHHEVSCLITQTTVLSLNAREICFSQVKIFYRPCSKPSLILCISFLNNPASLPFLGPTTRTFSPSQLSPFPSPFFRLPFNKVQFKNKHNYVMRRYL